MSRKEHRAAAPRVLIVDDEDAVRTGLAEWLGERGFSVLTAADLRSAMIAALGCGPDVILLDVKLGEENGLELVQRMNESAMTIPVVVFTAYAGPSDGFEAHKLGVQALIEKPSSPGQIARILARVIDERPRALSAASPRSANGSVPVCVIEAARLIQNRFRTKGLSVGALAQSVGVSPGHLGKLFRRHMGNTVVAYIHQNRVARAAVLLTNSDLSVKAIADECGYHGAAELHRHFSRRTGQSPNGFRRSEVRASPF